MDKESRIRYARQIAVKDIGIEGQEKLLKSKVLIVGCGALGSMVAMQLAGAGVGNLTILDFDNIEISNLQRQFFFKTNEAGSSKAKVLAERVKELNPTITVRALTIFLSGKNSDNLIREHDFIVDATDNPESKKMIGEICAREKRPCCIAGVSGFSGQIMTFLPGEERFEEYFGNESAEGVLPCSSGGVIGSVAALSASVQASEVLKYLTGSGELLNNKLFLFNLLENKYKVISI